ncbi:GntR family transcriptional regulator [Geminisphaera colitermitum]|uniref:GntR family transcriptional regulator n=1 Tax=Geminisphaera colitermitum TaxID=1148786 RepID=UPI0001965052|nr:substrate-binding domain-containing protein [Geminisphaera colitermitum]
MNALPAPQLKYRHVEDELRKLARTLPVGARFPAERNLAVTYDCNVLTVRRALKHLVDDGIIVRRIGSGTFVALQGELAGSVGEGMAAEAGVNEARRGLAPDRAAVAAPVANRIGLLVSTKGGAYAYRILQAIAHEGLEENVDMCSRWVRDFCDDAFYQAELLRKEGCVALVIPWFPHERMDDVRVFVQRSLLPVCLPMAIPGLERNSFVEPSLFGAGTGEAVEALCRYYRSMGRSRIAFLGPDAPADVIFQRFVSAYVCDMSREGLPALCGLVKPGSQAMDQLAERWREFTGDGDLAVISYDDEHALRFMTAMHKLGLSAPGDFRIIGFNDTDASIYSDPPLSTIHQNFDFISHWLVKNALALAQGKVCQATKVPPISLLIRGTCGGLGKINRELREQLETLGLLIEEGGGGDNRNNASGSPVSASTVTNAGDRAGSLARAANVKKNLTNKRERPSRKTG